MTEIETLNEVVTILYCTSCIASGGRDLLDDSNKILLTAIKSGTISRPDTRQAILAIIGATSRGSALADV